MPHLKLPPEPVIGDALFEYFIEHARATVHANGTYTSIFEITKPLKAFKMVVVRKNCAVRIRAIANLLLPVGAFVYAPPGVFRPFTMIDERKMRANVAEVHSLSTRYGDPLSRAWSDYDSEFLYAPGKRVMPRHEPFDLTSRTCSSGIHFFLNLFDAFYYR